MQNLKKYYAIEQIHDKYYIFNSLIMKFEKDPFNSYKDAENYINHITTMCELMCN